LFIGTNHSTNLVNGTIKNPKRIAVDALNITFSTAFHITGLFANQSTSLVNQIYCQKKIIPIIHDKTLKIT
jgi:hypothetical protein